MSLPYIPTPFATPVTNPAVAVSGIAPYTYVSTSQFAFAPTAVDGKNIVPGAQPPQGNQAFASVLARATSWVNDFCFGQDPSSQGASLTATMSVQSTFSRVINGELRLICAYRPIIQVIGIDVGLDPSSTSTVGPTVASQSRIAKRTVYVPVYGSPLAGRPNDYAPTIGRNTGRVYAVWSYVSGYPHTALAANAALGANSLVVQATNGSGGLWGVFPGTVLTIWDAAAVNENVVVSSVTSGATTATINLVSPLQSAHAIPQAPDFTAVSAVPDSIQEATIALAKVLIKARGTKAYAMPTSPGGTPTRQELAQAGAIQDAGRAFRLLARYKVHVKGTV